MVTGSPDMISKSSTKSSRCIGSSLASAARRPRSSSARIISRMATMRSLLEEHVLGAAQADAFGAEAAAPSRASVGRLGIGAHLHAAHGVGPFHQRRELAGQLRLAASRPRPSSTWPVEPSMVMMSPFLKVLAAGDEGARLGSRRGCAPAPETQGLPMPRATTAAWLGHAAARGQDAFGGMHAVDVLGAGLDAHQDDACGRPPSAPRRRPR